MPHSSVELGNYYRGQAKNKIMPQEAYSNYRTRFDAEIDELLADEQD